MRVVHEAVENGVGVGGITDDLMPGGQRELRGDDRRSAAVSLLKDFKQVVTGAGVEELETEVVEDEKIGAAEGSDQARMAPVASGERQVAAEFRPAMIEDGAIVAAGFVADGAGQPTLSDAGRADQDQIVVGVDPVSPRRAFGTRRDRDPARRGSRRLRRLPDGVALLRSAAPPGACLCATRSPYRGAGRASRRGRDP